MSDNGVHKRPIIINLFPKKSTSASEPISNVQESIETCCSKTPCALDGDYTEFSSTPDHTFSPFLSEDSDSDRETQPGIKRKFVENWKTLYPFIEYDKEKNIMFCKICKQFANHRQKGIRFVTGSSNFRATSIQYHEKSVLHAKCQKRAIALLNGNSNPVELLDSDRKKLIQVLKLVYFMVQTRSPFTYFPQLCESQKLEGVDVGPAYTSHEKVVPLFAKYISLVLEKKLAVELSKLKLFSVIIDNCFSRASEKHELLYVKYLDGDRLRTVFLGVIDSTKSNFESIYKNLCKLFERFNIADWAEKVVCVTIDSVFDFQPWHDDLVKLIKEKSSNFICCTSVLPHKIKCCSKIFENNLCTSQFCILIYEIFWYYENLPDDSKNLSHIGRELDSIVQEYGKLPKNISACFSLNALKAVSADWVPLIQFMSEQNHSILHTKVRKIGAKILLLITRSQFLWKLAVVLDILNCLNEFACKVQDPDNVFSFHLHLINSCRDIKEAAQGKGEVVRSFIQDMTETPSSFRGISIRLDASLDKVIAGFQLLTSNLLNHLNKQVSNQAVFDNCHILDTRTWLKQDNFDTFGNLEYSKLHVVIEKSDEIQHTALSEWRSLKESVINSFPSELLLKPRAAISTMVATLASDLPRAINILKKFLLFDFSCEEVEKGYREMNLIKSSERCMLSVQSLQYSMMIVMHGPPFAQFNPAPAIELWMKECSRRYHIRSRQKISTRTILSNCDTFLESFDISNNLNSL
ncbi:zinc finger protein 862-like [Argiope bruennichi]|uniref:Zinc finger protein 862 like protein n=1 Tax=Argiope bruennichi TaxID=94029 RepID=A0A8T0F962_ARGBR|nr:zinc finger protein 862-like [Argiope bruennichi]KAF8786902.1 Zinc finger protein 862 like protein [Argiope bruennichi]